MVREYVAIDLETTGLSVKRDRITEIALLHVKEKTVVDEFISFINPRMWIPEYIEELTGINNDMVSDAPYIEEVFPDIVRFCADLPLLGHHVITDYSFLKRIAVNQNIDWEKDGIDTLKIARAKMPPSAGKKLTQVAGYLRIETGCMHRAQEDAYISHLIYEEFLKQKEDCDDSLFSPHPLIYTVKKEKVMTVRQKEYLIDLLKYHRIGLPVEIDSLNRSDASRQIDRIVSTYGRLKG